MAPMPVVSYFPDINLCLSGDQLLMYVDFLARLIVANESFLDLGRLHLLPLRTTTVNMSPLSSDFFWIPLF
jgi:hypothetical protein